MYWIPVHKGNQTARRLADGHYSRQTPGSPQFTRPGDNLVLLGRDCMAFWVSWRPAVGGRMDGLDAWECTHFRNLSGRRSSDLIHEAVQITVATWGPELPADGFITFIDPQAVQSEVPGYCFRRARFRSFKTSADGKLKRLRLTRAQLRRFEPVPDFWGPMFELEVA